MKKFLSVALVAVALALAISATAFSTNQPSAVSTLMFDLNAPLVKPAPEIPADFVSPANTPTPLEQYDCTSLNCFIAWSLGSLCNAGIYADTVSQHNPDGSPIYDNCGNVRFTAEAMNVLFHAWENAGRACEYVPPND